MKPWLPCGERSVVSLSGATRACEGEASDRWRLSPCRMCGQVIGVRLLSVGLDASNRGCVSIGLSLKDADSPAGLRRRQHDHVLRVDSLRSQNSMRVEGLLLVLDVIDDFERTAARFVEDNSQIVGAILIERVEAQLRLLRDCGGERVLRISDETARKQSRLVLLEGRAEAAPRLEVVADHGDLRHAEIAGGLA